jgi:hypothetical protein
MSFARSKFDAPSELVGTVRTCPSDAKNGNTPDDPIVGGQSMISSCRAVRAAGGIGPSI